MCRPFTILWVTQVIKRTPPIRPIFYSRGIIAYWVANIIFEAIVGHSPHHIRHIQTFVDQYKPIRLEEGECITSCDVKVLFTSMPADPAISIIKHKLQQDTQHHRTFISGHQIITGTWCSHGFPISHIVVNLFMEEFETKVINITPNPPGLWLSYVDDTFVI